MRAKVTRAFKGVPDGAVYPKLYKEGDVVEGNLAAAAIASGWGQRAEEPPLAAASERSGLAPEAPSAVRAKLIKRHVHNDEAFARGLIVEGDLARLFVEQGVAELIVPSDKSVPGAPATK